MGWELRSLPIPTHSMLYPGHRSSSLEGKNFLQEKLLHSKSGQAPEQTRNHRPWKCPSGYFRIRICGRGGVCSKVGFDGFGGLFQLNYPEIPELWHSSFSRAAFEGTTLRKNGSNRQFQINNKIIPSCEVKG